MTTSPDRRVPDPPVAIVGIGALFPGSTTAQGFWGDIVAGRAAGMQTVVAAYGYLSSEDRPWLWNPHGVVERPEDLLEWVTLRHLAAQELP